jgi:hypothetical protein
MDKFMQKNDEKRVRWTSTNAKNVETIWNSIGRYGAKKITVHLQWGEMAII